VSGGVREREREREREKESEKGELPPYPGQKDARTDSLVRPNRIKINLSVCEMIKRAHALPFHPAARCPHANLHF
jgi:hypothetical protein